VLQTAIRETKSCFDRNDEDAQLQSLEKVIKLLTNVGLGSAARTLTQSTIGYEEANDQHVIDPHQLLISEGPGLMLFEFSSRKLGLNDITASHVKQLVCGKCTLTCVAKYLKRASVRRSLVAISCQRTLKAKKRCELRTRVLLHALCTLGKARGVKLKQTARTGRIVVTCGSNEDDYGPLDGDNIAHYVHQANSTSFLL